MVTVAGPEHSIEERRSKGGPQRPGGSGWTGRPSLSAAITGRSSRIPTWLLVAVPTAVAAFVNFLWIGRQSLWMDEGFTAQMVTGPWSEFWRQIFTFGDGNAVGYYLLLRLWPFHEDEAGLRSLSALCIVASVPLVFWIGRQLGGRAAGWWAACFFALWLTIVEYGQEARSYSLLILITLAATAALLKATRTDGPRWWIAYGVLLGLGMYVHMFAALMVLPHVVWIAVRRPPIRRVALAAGIAALVAAPMLVYLAHYGNNGIIAWISRPTLGSLWDEVIVPLSGYSYYKLAALVLAVLGLGAVVVLRQRAELPAFALLVTWACAPLLVALAYSLLAHPVLLARYVIYVIPAWALLLGVAIAKIPVRVASVVAGVVVLAICARSMERYYAGGAFPKAEIREAAALVASQTRPGDAVVELSGLQPALDYYWRNVPRPTVGTGGCRLWVVASDDPTPPESAAAWHLVWRQNFYQVAVALYAPVSENATGLDGAQCSAK